MAKELKDTQKEFQKRTNGDSAIYVRIKADLLKVFREGWEAYLEKHDLNPNTYGIGSFIRSQAQRQCLRDNASKTRDNE